MHIIFGVVGVLGFSIFGAVLPDLYVLKSGNNLDFGMTETVSKFCCAAFLFISTYFIFG